MMRIYQPMGTIHLTTNGVCKLTRVPYHTRKTVFGLRGDGGGGFPLYMGYIGMCGPVLVINRVSILAILPPF